MACNKLMMQSGCLLLGTAQGVLGGISCRSCSLDLDRHTLAVMSTLAASIAVLSELMQQVKCILGNDLQGCDKLVCSEYRLTTITPWLYRWTQLWCGLKDSSCIIIPFTIGHHEGPGQLTNHKKCM